MIQWEKRGTRIAFFMDEGQILSIQGIEGATDYIKECGCGVYLWERVCEPTDHMEMSLRTSFSPDFYMVPGANYNGNGFGTFGEYTGDRYKGVPWVYGWHRASVPAMTMSQGKVANREVSVSLFGKANDQSSCSIYRDGDVFVQKILWPEEESPKQLKRYRFDDAYYTTMEKRNHFTAWIVIEEDAEPRIGYKKAFDIAFAHNQNLRGDKKEDYPAEKIWQLGIAYAKTLYTEEADGFCGFNIGLRWNDGQWKKRDKNKYEIGWCGQNALLANSMLREALHNPENDECRRMGLNVLDSWIKHATLPINVIRSYYDPGQERYLEACNLGTAGLEFFEAYELANRLGENRESYLKAAMDICEFAAQKQKGNGSFAKCWREDGTEAIEEGSVGAFLAMPLIKAAKYTGDTRYQKCAEKALRYYMQELERQGFTTAGALDIFSIDKESAISLLKSAMMLYKLTGEIEWLKDAEKAAWYLSTWQYSCTERFPQDTDLGQSGYDSFGGTLVSTVHPAIDSFALNYVPELYELYKATNDKRWYDRAKAAWQNGCQHISDGTLRIKGIVRPAGSQDEAYEVTKREAWGFSTCWLVAWPSAFRLDILRKMWNIPEARDFFRQE